MVEIQCGDTAKTMEYFHDLLDAHFRTLHDRRRSLDTSAPVFALEHGLSEDDLSLLNTAVVAAHRKRLVARASHNWWLPLVVHASEVGYIYDGVEFWPIYADKTLGWTDNEHERDRVRKWFQKFAEEYGGAIPQGAWATTFRKIAWPITHAVLPRYLQVQLAEMLYDYRTGWPSMLDDPEALGKRLHIWSRSYGERLEKFCQNTALLGHVAVALLLSGEDEPSPYIESSTLDRLVESLNSERQTRRWLRDARHSARTIRTRNFRPSAGKSQPTPERRVPAITDPKLQLKLEGHTWRAYAVIPDLKPLQHSLPIVYDEMRNSRASVAGSRDIIRSGALLYALAPLELSTWPSPTEPFLQLTNATREVNLLIADQCRMTSGPWWVFRRKEGEPAGEVKGKFVRPGGVYCIVGSPDLTPPDVTWCDPVELAVEGVSAYSLRVPAVLTESDSTALTSSGLSVVSDLSIHPVGVVASSWDGEGSVEWLAGEPALIMIHAEHSPRTCRLTINGDPYFVEWPESETDLFLSLDALAVGTHEVDIALGDPEGQGRSTCGSLIVTIRGPQAPRDGAWAGEGIRLRTSPAQPTLPELWDGRAVVEVDGPEKTSAELAISLRDGNTQLLGRTVRRQVELPVTGDDWRRLFTQLRGHNDLARHYDEADVAGLVISRAGVGFATLTCERGFRGLRWVVTKSHDYGYTARLIDRTDGDAVAVDFYPMESPVMALKPPAGHVFVCPERGGLLWASSDGEVAGQIIPPDPNQLFRTGATTPFVPDRPKDIAEVNNLITHHYRWREAELPAHPFGVRDREVVLKTLTTALMVMLAPGKWAHFERKIAELDPEDVDLNRAQDLVGCTTSQRTTAQAIASQLWRWNSPEAIIAGFADAIADLAMSSGMPDVTKGARLLLQLASSPGDLVDWNKQELNQYLRCIFTDPVLVRVARFAVLGTTNEVAGGVG